MNSEQPVGTEPLSIDSWLPIVYDELKRVAAAFLAKERKGHSLQATDLVHEVYLRLSKDGSAKNWASRRYLFAAASIAIRRILVDRARQRLSAKRSGNHVDHGDFDITLVQSTTDRQLLLLDEGLDELAKKEAHIADLVHLRYFSGVSIEEAATMLGISPRTASRQWSYARAWLKLYLVE